MTPISEAIDVTDRALVDHQNWVLGFSGGKDSSALLLLFQDRIEKSKFRGSVSVIYCDTGVENVVLDRYIKRLFDKFGGLELPQFNFQILQAPPHDGFFAKIIGRGYPPPTNSFRWCTKQLRIKPVVEFIDRQTAEGAVCALGIRKSESEQRRRSISKSDDPFWQVQREGKGKHPVFAPLVNFTTQDVWDYLYLRRANSMIDPELIESIYRDASGECPVIKEPTAPPCASGRFGCWTCTVVRKDRSARNQIQAGQAELLPYLEFRDWLAQFRNDLSYRWERRRNGTASPGPFNFDGRIVILSKIRELESAVGAEIISPTERNEIVNFWRRDIGHPFENSRKLYSESELVSHFQ